MLSSLLSQFGADCSGGSFLAFPTWYQHLDGTVNPDGSCTPKITSLSDTWIIIANIIEILLRVGAIVAVGVIIYGGISYVISQGEPEKTAKAKQAIIGALIGLIISIMATTLVNFIAGSIH